MIRLLLAVLIVSLTVAYFLDHRKGEQKKEVIYHEQLDKAEAVEYQLQEQLERQMRQVDESSR